MNNQKDKDFVNSLKECKSYIIGLKYSNNSNELNEFIETLDVFILNFNNNSKFNLNYLNGLSQILCFFNGLNQGFNDDGRIHNFIHNLLNFYDFIKKCEVRN